MHHSSPSPIPSLNPSLNLNLSLSLSLSLSRSLSLSLSRNPPERLPLISVVRLKHTRQIPLPCSPILCLNRKILELELISTSELMNPPRRS